MKWKLLFPIITCFLASQAAIASQKTPLSVMQGLNQPIHHKVERSDKDRTYHLLVRLPESYKDSSRDYPALYLLDGGHNFPMLASYYRYLNFAEEVPDMIIVGLSYGTDEFRKGNTRGNDYTAPSRSASHYGGAAEFSTFLQERIFPLIEKSYNANPKQRIIFGQSLAGQYVLYAAFYRPSLFWGHIASNPALHNNLDFFLKAPDTARSTGSLLYVGLGSNDDPRFRTPAQTWKAHWENKQIPQLRLQIETLQGESHMSAAPLAFRRGLLWLQGQ